MSNPGRNSRGDAGVSRARLIVGLLLLILLLVLGLVWQASQTMHTNRAAATAVLQDYARLAGDEYSRRAMGQIGYYGYYAHINALRQQLLGGGDILLSPDAGHAGNPDMRAAELAAYRFLIEPALGRVRTSRPLDADAGIERYLAERGDEILQQPATESGLTIDHEILDGVPHTFVFATADSSDAVFGFEVGRSILAAQLQQVFEGNSLLPESLAGGAVSNDFVFLRFTDNSGKVLFESGDDYDPYLLVIQAIDDEYGGIFKGHTIATAIDTAVADSLVIGGLPRSRLPILIVTVILTIALLLAAIWQLRREYALMKLRSDFVSEVSHELRTPLTQIRMFTETLLFERFQTADDKRRALEIINRESQRLIHLVENVLRFTGRNGEQRGLNVVRTRLAPLIESVVEEFRPLADAAENTIRTELAADIEAEVDPNALRQILLNLIDNAVKYGPAGQDIDVKLARRSDGVWISVCDQGPGVPLADRERIWGGYYRLTRERDSAIAGTGIGLAVVRDLATQLGGTARVDAGGTGHGACFTIELPAISGPA